MHVGGLELGPSGLVCSVVPGVVFGVFVVVFVVDGTVLELVFTSCK